MPYQQTSLFSVAVTLLVNSLSQYSHGTGKLHNITHCSCSIPLLILKVLQRSAATSSCNFVLHCRLALSSCIDVLHNCRPSQRSSHRSLASSSRIVNHLNHCRPS